MASRSAGANTVSSPPISTLFARLRATCVKIRGADACTICRHMPRGKRTRSPCTSAPASANICSASASLWNSIPTCSRIVSAFSSIVDKPFVGEHLERRHRAGQIRHVLDDCVGAQCLPGGAPAGAAARTRLAHLALLFSLATVARRRRGRSRSAGWTFAWAAAAPWRPAVGTGRCRAGWPSHRRNAPGSAARRPSRSSRRGGRRPRSRRATCGRAAQSALRCRRRSRPR